MMENYICNATPKSPYVSLNAESGILEINGWSTPEDPQSFYQPAHQWIDRYIKAPAPLTVFIVWFQYLNKPSKKELWLLLSKFKILRPSSGHEFIINWHYEKDDADMYELGEDLKYDLKLPVNLIKIDPKTDA